MLDVLFTLGIIFGLYLVVKFMYTVHKSSLELFNSYSVLTNDSTRHMSKMNELHISMTTQISELDKNLASMELKCIERPDELCKFCENCPYRRFKK